MNPADWFDYVAKNEDYIIERIRDSFPDLDPSSILPGLPHTIYLRKRHGTIELTFDAMQVELDDQGKIARMSDLAPENSAGRALAKAL